MTIQSKHMTEFLEKHIDEDKIKFSPIFEVIKEDHARFVINSYQLSFDEFIKFVDKKNQ